MRSIGIFSRKGGVGKSTLAIHLSTLAQNGGRTLLVDTDPQASIDVWMKRRESDTMGFAAVPLGDLPSVLRAATDSDVRWALVDTPPIADDTVADAMTGVDFVLIPVRPSLLDVASVVETVRMAQGRDIAYGCVLTMCPPRRGFAVADAVREVRSILVDIGAPVFRTEITHRVGYQNAVNSGESVTEFGPRSIAAREIAALWAEILEDFEKRDAAAGPPPMAVTG